MGLYRALSNTYGSMANIGLAGAVDSELASIPGTVNECAVEQLKQILIV